jgi:hypothetical protein
MKQNPDKSGKFGVTTTLTRARAEKISAVEGLKLSPKLAHAFDEFDRKGMTGDQKRAAIRSEFRKK